MSGPRPIVMALAVRMERKLRENSFKGGWRGERVEYLFSRALEELAELAELIYARDRGDPRISLLYFAAGLFSQSRPRAKHDDVAREAIADEAADVANMVMMIADVLHAIERPKAPPAVQS